MRIQLEIDESSLLQLRHILQFRLRFIEEIILNENTPAPMIQFYNEEIRDIKQLKKLIKQSILY